MIVFPTKDLEVIKKVLCDEWVYNRICEDGSPPREEYEPCLDTALYLTDEDGSGIFILHSINSVTGEIHIQMLDRSKAMEFGKACLDWVWSHTDALKLIAQIPEIYPDVCKFSEKQGFRKEGVNRRSYKKDGKLHSQYYYGIERC